MKTCTGLPDDAYEIDTRCACGARDAEPCECPDDRELCAHGQPEGERCEACMAAALAELTATVRRKAAQFRHEADRDEEIGAGLAERLNRG